MTIQSKTEGSVFTISFASSLDMEGVPAFEKCQELLMDDMKEVHFNFEKLEFIDSTGIGSIVQFVKAHERLSFQGINASEDIKEIFSIVGLDEFFSY